VSYPDALHGISDEQCLEEAEKAMQTGGNIGAILVEPIQGRGGIRAPKPMFLRELKLLAKRYEALLVADEIFTGFGRTGKMFAIEHSGVVPDLLCVGKALANGFPISACIGPRQIMNAWPESDGEAIHTSTFLGNPLGCAMAVASIKEMKRLKLAQRAAHVGGKWIEELRGALGDHPRVAEVRGRGLMIGIELVKNRKQLEPDAPLAARVLTEALQKGLLLLGGGSARNVLTLTPPLIISEKDIARATALLKDLLI
jgi:4-aminobutyrate aminotransferase-like enzyme